jgi:2,3-bisphosphoglycerate-independent phosphoglycerate mutase
MLPFFVLYRDFCLFQVFRSFNYITETLHLSSDRRLKKKFMKYCIVVPDGIADLPHVRTKNGTPLEIARKPALDTIASHGRLGMVKPIPPDLPCDSIVSTMNILGFDPVMYYPGRAVFFAATLGIPLAPEDWVFLCDFVSTFKGTMVDPRGGQIRSNEAELLIADLNQKFAGRGVEFYPGYGHRHLLVFHQSPEGVPLAGVDPFNIRGQALSAHYPQGQGSKLLIELMEEAHSLLQDHEINKIRQELNENPADSVWLWGGGKTFELPSFQELYKLHGAVISASPEIQGFGKLVGLSALAVPCITGSWNTNFSGKVEGALKALATFDLVYLHMGALVEVSRYGDVAQKVRLIGQIDEKVIEPIQKGLPANTRLMVVGGHFVSVQNGIGKSHRVPFVIWSESLHLDTGRTFDEKSAQNAGLLISPGDKLLPFFISP